jgi:hypothetical protein
MSPFACLLFVARIWAADIEGVLPASMDQPRIYLAVSREAKGEPLTAKAGKDDAVLAKLLGHKPGEAEPVFAVEAFLDTGASGVMLAEATAASLGVQKLSLQGKPVTYYDVGVAGREAFGVAEPLFFRVADYSGNSTGQNINAYQPAGGRMSAKIRGGGGMLEQLVGAIDIAGTPLMAGKVMVVDCRPLAKMDKLRTQLLPAGDKSIPGVDVVVPLTYVDFDRFTTIEPGNAQRPTTATNPLIGPNPFDRADKATSVTVTFGGKSAKLSMLLDTGAAASMISTDVAKSIGVQIDASGKLTNIPAKEQFTLPIGGVGGTKDVHGFYLDTLQLPVVRGEPIRYLKCPVLVQDISVTDAATGEKFTLAGIFGMNYLVASANVSTGLGAGVDEIHDGAFSFFTVDSTKKVMGLKLK